MVIATSVQTTWVRFGSKMVNSIEEEREYVKNKFHSPRVIVLNILTLGWYGWANCFSYGRRVGLV